MTDIVERLREMAGYGSEGVALARVAVLDEAADEIERLLEEKEALAKHIDGTVRVAAEALHEIERLKADKAAISDTASGYLHENDRLQGEVADLSKSIQSLLNSAGRR